MTASQLLDRLNRTGACLEVVDGIARLRGGRIPEELKEELRSNRVEVLAEFERRKNGDRERYGLVPPLDAPLLSCDVEPSVSVREAVMAHVMLQPRPVHAWVMARASLHYERGAKVEDCDWRACVDVIGWQRKVRASEVMQFVLAIGAPHDPG